MSGHKVEAGKTDSGARPHYIKLNGIEVLADLWPANECPSNAQTLDDAAVQQPQVQRKPPSLLLRAVVCFVLCCISISFVWWLTH
ncbi:MAG: hypothetical protein FWC28_02715 [Proteobacteria bacterium]|nr:hypothetical protein [Cystobacterineae bacterium]MCL2259386.1 hypothetical protein [Cystobacterineae bacterium]MCL2314151.1 hypothetical protein [Pseudomonadota bacterium]